MAGKAVSQPPWGDTLPTNRDEWRALWSQAKSPCIRDKSCSGWVIFEQLNKAFAAPGLPSEQQGHLLGLLLTDLTIDHSDCISAFLQEETRCTLCSNLEKVNEPTLGWAAAALSTTVAAGAAKQAKCSYGCPRSSKCRGGRRCPKRPHEPPDTDTESAGPSSANAAPNLASGKQPQQALCGMTGCTMSGNLQCKGGRRCSARNKAQGIGGTRLQATHSTGHHSPRLSPKQPLVP